MQQIITFRIDVFHGFEDIQDRIVQLIRSYDYDTVLGEDATSKRINTWISNIIFTANGDDSGTITNYSESTMYEFDYVALFPQLFYDLADAYPMAFFHGHSEFYTDDYGIMEEHNFSHPINNRNEENTMIETFNKEELIAIIRKILAPLTPVEIAEVCENIGIDANGADIPAAIYNDAVESYDESLDGIMEYIHNNLIDAVISVAGIIIYDPEWNGRRL